MYLIFYLKSGYGENVRYCKELGASYVLGTDISNHMIEGTMVHFQLSQYFGFLGMKGYEKCHKYHYLIESKELANLSFVSEESSPFFLEEEYNLVLNILIIIIWLL